ncbi:MAG: protein kinase domain-containing protein [Marinicella pacifica]
MSNHQSHVNELLKKILSMETQDAFEYLNQSDAPKDVIDEVALLMTPSKTRTAFLNDRGLLESVLNDLTEKDLSGQSIQNLKLIQPLGQGGMGQVYLAEDTTLKRRVAVKILHRNHSISPQAKERFRREAMILSQLDHSNICRIYNLLENPDSDILVLELIEGQTLREAQTEHWSNARKIRTAMALLEALKVTHNQNIIHRDLKPENIMLTHSGQLKVLDFGISRLESKINSPKTSPNRDKLPVNTTVQGAIMGTLTYMSPEQATGDEVTTASDIYTLGLVFQELFSQTPVYKKDLTAEQLLDHSSQAKTQKPTDLSHDLTHLIERMKSASPAQRPTAVDALAMLKKIQQKPARRLKWLAAVVAVLVVSVAVFKYISDLSHERNQAQIAQHKAEKAQQQAEQVASFLVSIFEVSNPFLQKAEDITAIDLLNQGAEKINTELDDELELHHVMKATIGDVFHVLGRMEKAESLIQPAYEQIKDMNDASAANKQAIASQYATLRMDQGDFDQALKLFKASNQYQPDNLETILFNKNYMALIHIRLNQFDQALAITDEIIQIAQQNPQTNPQHLADAHNARGMGFLNKGELSQAENSFNQALDIIDKKQPDNVLGLKANLMGNLAHVYSLTDRRPESIKLRHQVIEIYEAQLPPFHADLIGAYDNLAVDYFFLQDLEQAKFWNRKSLDVFEHIISVNPDNGQNFNYEYGMTLANYGILLTKNEDYQQALDVFRQVVELMTQALGPKHDTVAAYQFELADALYHTGNSEQALVHIEQAQAIFPHDDIPFHRRELRTWLLKATIMHEQGNHAEVEAIKQVVIKTLNAQDPVNEAWLKLAKEKFDAFKTDKT